MSTTSKKKKKKIRSPFKRFIVSLIKILTVFFILFTFAIGGIVGGAILGYIRSAEPITPEDLILHGVTTQIYDVNGELIMPLRGEKNREMVSFAEIPQHLKDAFIAIEDKRFYQHNGIDFRRFAGAAINYTKNLIKPSGETYGGSTITQQVIKNITGENQVSLKRKIQEQWRALELERHLSKDQILELYMNIIPMGGNHYGVQTAAKVYFDKDVRDLTIAESASLAGITNWPSRYTPFTEQGRKNNLARQRIILAEMLSMGAISQSEYEEAINEEVQFATYNSNSAQIQGTQSFFVDQVVLDVRNALMERGLSEGLALKRIYNDGLKIYTTMDLKIQSAMDEVFQNEANFTILNPNAGKAQASMVIMDPYTGHIRAMYGSSGPKVGGALNRATQIKRQPGSTIKPIAVYGPAIDQKLITAASIVDDVPIYLLGADRGLYPRNYDRRYYGLVTTHQALKRSYNVSAAKTWLITPSFPDISLMYLRRVNINRDNERHVALSLGGLREGVSPLEMAASYVPFVNKGMYREPITYLRVEDSRGNVILENSSQVSPVYSEAAAYVMTDILKSVARSGGTAFPHGLIQNGNMPSAGKTGTSSDNIDKWYVGYSPYYVAATWYGHDKPTPLNPGEYNRALLLWNAVMEKVHRGLPHRDFLSPSNIVRKDACIYSGKTPSELCEHDPRGSSIQNFPFIKGTEPKDSDICDVHVKVEVCTDATDIHGRNLLAGPYCPSETVVERVLIQRPEEYKPLNPGDPYPLDWKYEVPAAEYCNIHTEPPVIETEEESEDSEDQGNILQNGINRFINMFDNVLN